MNKHLHSGTREPPIKETGDSGRNVAEEEKGNVYT